MSILMILLWLIQNDSVKTRHLRVRDRFASIINMECSSKSSFDLMFFLKYILHGHYSNENILIHSMNKTSFIYF